MELEGCRRLRGLGKPCNRQKLVLSRVVVGVYRVVAPNECHSGRRRAHEVVKHRQKDGASVHVPLSYLDSVHMVAT